MKKLLLLLLCLSILSACNIEAPPTTPNPVPTDDNSNVIQPEATLQDPNAGIDPTAQIPPTATQSSTLCLQAGANSLPFGTDAGAQTLQSDTVPLVEIDRLPNGRAFPGQRPQTANVPNQPERDTVLIRFTAESTPNERNEYIRSIGGTSRKQIDALNTYVVGIRPNVSISDLPASPIVISTEPEYVAGATQAGSLNSINDPRVGEQWALPLLGIPSSWSQIQNSRGNLIIAVVDSGVCTDHPDLQGRTVAGFDFVENDSVPQDLFGHGCGVAGIIAANANNGVGIAGIAPNAQIMPIRVLDNRGLGSYSTIAQGIIYAADNGANVINLSLAGPSNSIILQEAVNYALARNIVVIAAAGNFGQNGAYYPAALPGVIGVGSIDNDLQRSDFSHFGNGVDVYAPGKDLLTISPNGGYEMKTGTSFAAPVVSGLAAIQYGLGVDVNLLDEAISNAFQTTTCN